MSQCICGQRPDPGIHHVKEEGSHCRCYCRMCGCVPTTDEVRAAWAEAWDLDRARSLDENGARFDAWLAVHDRQVAERAWDEARQKVRDAHPGCTENCDLCIARDEVLDDLSENPHRKERTDGE